MEGFRPLRSHNVKYHPSLFAILTRLKPGTVFGGQFNWGGCLLNDNGGAQWSAISGWKSESLCIRKSRPDWETYKSIRHESGRK